MLTPDLKLAIDDKPTRISILLTWAARVAVAAAFAFIGLTKFNDNPRSEWVKVFDQIGFGQWFRYFTGGVQLAGALFIMIPRTMTIGAFLLACTMISAMVVDIVVMHAAGFALLPGALLGVVIATWFTGRYGVIASRSGDW
jgi:uncharacterized membrane protein YphA (DoxX/SURF4 family)